MDDSPLSKRELESYYDEFLAESEDREEGYAEYVNSGDAELDYRKRIAELEAEKQALEAKMLAEWVIQSKEDEERLDRQVEEYFSRQPQTVSAKKRVSKTNTVEANFLDAVVEIRQDPHAIDKAFMARQLVQCTLPHKDPGNVPIWRRTNGSLTLSIRPYIDPKTDESLYPYGSTPRLLLYWMTTEAVRTKNRRLHLGNSLADFMLQVGLSPRTGGGKRSDAKRLVKHVTRLLRATISFDQQQKRGRSTQGQSWLDMQIGPRAMLWWDPAEPDQDDLFDSWIELSHDFFAAITAATVPLDLRALKALRKSPLALDLYSLLSYKTWWAQQTNTAQDIPWASLVSQMGSEYTGLRGLENFKAAVGDALKKIRRVYEGVDVEKTEAGLVIRRGSTSVPSRTF